MHVINGSRDIIELLEEALELAKAGEIDVVGVIIGRGSDIEAGYNWRDDATHAWSRLVSGCRMLEHALLEAGE